MSTIAKNLDEESKSMRRGGFAEILEDLAEEEKLNIEEIREEALRIYFNLRPELKLEGAIISYMKGRCSLSRAAELAGVIVPEFKEILASKGVIRETEGKEVHEMDRKIKDVFLSMRN